MSILGLDVGTTGCKAVVFDYDGGILAGAYREYPLLHPREGWNELETGTLWSSITGVLGEANEKLSAEAVRDPVEAMAVSCQGEAVLPVDRNGEPLYNFIITFDARTEKYRRWWEQRLSPEQIFSRTGMPLHPMYSINKILWFMQERPELYRRTWKFLCVEDYVNFRLTGRPVIDYSLAARTMAFDVEHHEWSPIILEQSGVDRELLAEPVPSGTAIGTMGEELRRELGFRRKVNVAAGGHDQACGALGAGVFEPGTAMAAMGTSEVICPVSDKPVLTPFMLRHNYSSSDHVEPEKYIALAVNLNGGLLLRWYRDTLCGTEVREAERRGADPYEIIIGGASEEWKRIFVLPHLVGSGTPWFDTSSRGAIVGLTNETTKGDITRALLKSLVLETRIDLEFLSEAGFDIRELEAIGGGARSSRWLQMKADGLGIPVRRMEVTEAASLGAALLAGVSTGIYSDLPEAIVRTVRGGTVFEPAPEEAERYSEHFEEYRELYPVLKPFYRSGEG